jgi:hypothetical protein
LAIETDEDRLAFFSADDFGYTATITITGGATLTDVPGIYEDPHLTRGLKQNNQFSYNQGQDMSGSKPTFRCRTIDVPGVRNGRANMTVFLDGVPVDDFTVFDVQGDGTGLTTIRLMRA